MEESLTNWVSFLQIQFKKLEITTTDCNTFDDLKNGLAYFEVLHSM